MLFTVMVPSVPSNKKTGWICLGIVTALLLAVSVVVHVIKTAAVAVPVTESERRHSGGGSIKHLLIGRSCAEAFSADPTIPSGDYYVDPDGANIGDRPIIVYCNMSTGTTMVSHDSEETIDVGNCKDAGCYSRVIKYAGGATMRQLAALVDLSSSCRQSIRYDCFGAPLEFGGVQESWWNDRNGVARYFWSGSDDNNNQHTCQCGIGKNCVHANQKCNCDAMAFVQVSDNGILTDKNSLPVTRLNFGRIAIGANGKHTIGKFECSGRVILDGTMPTSCHDLFIAGNVISGLFTVSVKIPGHTRTVYCNFSKQPTSPEYETIIANTAADFQALHSQVAVLQSQVTALQSQVNNIGKPVDGPVPTDCDGVKALGWTQSGYYTIKGSDTQLKTVYCDFTKAPSIKGYETTIGFNDIKTAAGVYFYVQGHRGYSSAGSVIPYELERLNIGGAMNLQTGVFTAPVNGRYHFTFTAQSVSSGRTGNYVHLRVNGVKTGASHAPSKDYNLPILATLNLKKGDTVDMLMDGGAIWDDSDHFTQFSGVLLEEDLVL